MSSNTNIGNTPVNQGYVQLIHTGETGGIDGTLRTLYDGDGTASDLQIASNAVKISTQLYIGSKTITEYVQDVVGDMLDTNGSHTNITATYDDDGDGAIDLVATGAISSIIGGTGIDATGSGDITISIDSTVATKTYVDTEVAGLVDSAPGTLDTLNELAAALGDDPNFATTTATNIATKLAKASNLSDLTNAATARTNLGVDPAGTDNSTDVTLAGTLDYITLSGQQITRNAIDLTTDVTGVLPIGNIDSSVVTLTGSQTLTNKTLTSPTINTSLTFDSVSLSAIQTSGESFANNDTSLMTSAAVEDKILSYGYITEVGIDEILAADIIDSTEAFSDSDDLLMTAAAIDDLIISKGYGTGNGDITAVNAGVGIGGGATSGDVDLTFEGSELPDMTESMGPADEFVVLDGTTSKRKAISEIRLTSFDDTGFSSGISFNGSTANGLLTYGNSTTADVESNLTFTGSALSVTGTANVTSTISTDYGVRFNNGNTDFMFYNNTGDNLLYLRDLTNAQMLQTWTTSSTTIHKNLSVSGNVNATGDINVSDDVILNVNANFIYLRDASGTLTRTFGMNSGNTTYIGPIDAYAGGSVVYGLSSNVVDQIFYTSGSEKLRIKATTGNVGIGTNSPSTITEIKSTIPVLTLTDDQNKSWTSSDGTLGKLSFKTSDTSGIGVHEIGFISLDCNLSSSTTPNGELVFGTAGVNAAATEKMRIDEDGNVGIGTDSPAYKLHLEQAGGVMQQLKATDSNQAYMKFVNSATGDGQFTDGFLFGLDSDESVAIWNYEGTAMRFATSGTEKMRIDSSGRLLIGDTSVHYTGTDLQVGNTSDSQNGIQIQTSTTGNGYVLFGDGTGASAYRGQVRYDHTNDSLNLTAGYTETVYVKGGNVGIGTNSPSYKLDVAGTIRTTGEIYLDNGGDAIAFMGVSDANYRKALYASNDDHYVTNRHTGGDLILMSNNGSAGGETERLRFVAGSGTQNAYFSNVNVGIGETSPEAKLHIKNASAGTFTASNSQLLIENNTTCRLTLLSPATNGCKIEFGDINDQDVGMINYDHSNNYMQFFTNAGERARILSTGAFHVTNDVVAFSSTPSDKKLKTNVKDIEYGLDTIMKLNPKQYDWKKDNRHDIGFIAQEVEEVIPEIVKDNEWFDDKIKTMDYEKLTAVLIKAVQEQQQQINELKEKLNG